MRHEIVILVAMDHNNLIGKGNKLPWYLPNDLKHVKKTTENGVIVMGRKCFESLGSRPLANRTNVILTRDKDFVADGCIVCHSVDEVLDKLKNKKRFFIFGGREIYNLFLPYATEMILTRVHSEFAGDVYFPEIEWKEWDKVSSTQGKVDDKNKHHHTFIHFYRDSRYIEFFNSSDTEEE